VQHERVRLEVAQLLLAGLDEEGLREERVPGRIGDDANVDAVGGIGAGERVDDVDVSLVQMLGQLLSEAFETFFGDRLVDLTPGDPVLGLRLLDEELVLGRAARVTPRVDDQGTAFREPAFLADERVRVEE
jgi:hypothetical protein